MYKTIGILAHVDAGKTTFSEQILFHTKSIRKRGRVDHQDAYLDSHQIEKERGITVFCGQGMFSYNDDTYYLIDTPGHVDFSPEMERSIQIMDYAIVLISAVEGIEGHTETVWSLLKKHQIPTFFFINKIDRVGADGDKVVEEIRKNLTADVFDMTQLTDREHSEEFIEFVAERDEELLTYYIEHGYDKGKWTQALPKLIQEGKIFLSMQGSALQDLGIESFLKMIDTYTVTNYQSENPFAGYVYKIRHDENGTRITFIKALSGRLKVREELTYGDSNTEKITQIRLYNGEKFQSVDEVEAGKLFAVTGLSNVKIGDGLGTLQTKQPFYLVPALKSKVLFDSKVAIKEGLRLFKILEAEDPSLSVIWEETLQQIHIHVMGTIQLEVLEEIVLDRFHLKVTFAEPEILYKETIQSETMGYGHFEPLRHYAEVHLKLEPAERNSEITFENACHPDELSVGQQNLLRRHLFEREHHGILTGSPVTDVKITLVTGRAHHKHTSGGDFREATYRALRQGLEKAKNVVLEPFYQFNIKVDLTQMGRVLQDIQKAHGQADTPRTEGEKAIITGKAPVATFMDYGSELAAFTQGKGSISLVFSGYDRCHNEKEVIEKIAYNKEADPEYTSSSIFCAKGQGYSVPWDEAEAMMHCLKK